MRSYILAINPGATSTKIGIFKDRQMIENKIIRYELEHIKQYDSINDQLEFRLTDVMDFISGKYELDSFKAIVGRGGLLRPIPAGTYRVTEKMLEDLKDGYNGEHASNLGGQIAAVLAKAAGTEAYIVDPVVVDEIDDIARLSGIQEIERESIFHALNIRAIAVRAAEEQGFNLRDENIIVFHLGTGFSGCAMRRSRMVDVSNALEEGGFSPERAGSLPVLKLLKLAYSGKYSYAQMKKKLVGEGGLVSYLGTNDCIRVDEMVEKGDKTAKIVLDAMAYQVSKGIGALATVLEGSVRYIILTGGVAYSKNITSAIERRVSFIAPVIVMPGEDELTAMNEGTLRVITGCEKVKIYDDEIIISKKNGGEKDD